MAFDTETTGLSPVDDRVVELAAVSFRRDGSEVAVFEHLVDPGIPIPPEMTRIHGITKEMVTGRPAIEQILPEFLEFAGDGVLVAHNAPYDVSMLLVPLARMRVRSSLAPPGNLVLDTCALARSAFPGAASYRLGTVARALGVEHAQAHRALSDVRACKEVFLKILDKVGPDATLEDLVERNGAELHFGTTREMLDRLALKPDQAVLLDEALRTASQVRIRYQGGSKGSGPRLVTPITLTVQGGSLFLVAHCGLDRSVKNFKLDMISAIYPPAT
ncbi:MAG TPA: exonuclease domain-containing protein [Candidatus Polarisedimenticolia bacterium]